MVKERGKRTEHQEECKCAICSAADPLKAAKEVRAREAENMKKEGWYAHFIIDPVDGLGDVHTHGLPQSFHHPDLQIVYPLPPKIAHGILSGMVDQIKKGKKFEAGKRYSEVIENFDVLIVGAVECNRHIFRVILPGPDGKLGDEMKQPYAKQLAAMV